MSSWIVEPRVGVRNGEVEIRLGEARSALRQRLRSLRTWNRRDWYNNIAIEYEPQSDRVVYIGVCAGPGQRATLAPWAIECLADRAAGVVRRVNDVARLDVSSREPGFTFVYPDLELALWRGSDGFFSGWYFDEVSIAGVGYRSVDSMLRDCVLRDAPNAPPPAGYVGSSHFSWPNEAAQPGAFRRFAANLRAVPIPGLTIALFGSGFVDAYIDELAGVRSVTGLSFDAKSITQAGFSSLAALPNLRELRLLGSSPSSVPRGASLLANCVDLELIHIADRSLADKTLASMSHLLRLREVNLDQSSITAASASWFGTLRELRYLSLSRTRVDDRICDALASAPDLEELRLMETDITDAGVARLAQCRSLRAVRVRSARVSPGAIQRLKESLPDADVG